MTALSLTVMSTITSVCLHSGTPLSYIPPDVPVSKTARAMIDHREGRNDIQNAGMYHIKLQRVRRGPPFIGSLTVTLRVFKALYLWIHASLRARTYSGMFTMQGTLWTEGHSPWRSS